jgi:hypothetical protein
MVTGTLPAANGGTGNATYTAGDLLYASGATTLSLRAAVAAGQVLASNGVGAAPVWTQTPWVTSMSFAAAGQGQLTSPAADVLQLGAGSATPAAQTFRGANGSGTDKAGGALTVAGGAATGAAIGGSLFIGHSVATTGSDAVENTVANTWEFTAPTDVGDGTGVARSNLLPIANNKNDIGSTSLRIATSWAQVSRAVEFRDPTTYMVATYATAGVGKATFGSESANAVVELQSYKGTANADDGVRVWCYSGTQSAGNLLACGDGGTYGQKFAVAWDGMPDFVTANLQTTIGSNGAAAALTANPLGYIRVRVGGVAGTPGAIVLIPYYDWDGP